MKALTYTLNGELIQLRLTAGATEDVETRLGCGIPKVISEDKFSPLVEIVAGAVQGGDYEDRRAKALAIYDDMTENGKTFADYQLLAFEILVNAGFMNGAVFARLKEMTKQLSEKTAELSKVSQN